MSGRVAGKKALVTGAAQGLGAAQAMMLARHGAQVLLADINAAGAAAQAEAINAELGAGTAHAVALDVTREDQWIAAIEAASELMGGLSVLVNNAGVGVRGNIETCTLADWQRGFAINVDSVFLGCQKALPLMKDSQPGSIVNISSIASSVRGLPNRYVYGASKAAVIGLTKSVAADFIGKNIRCNAIGPGTVQSPSLDQRIKTLAATNNISEQAARESFVARQPMGRLGTAREIADIAVYLASDEAAFTTGQMYMVDGGMTI